MFTTDYALILGYLVMIGVVGSCVGFIKSGGSGIKPMLTRIFDGCFSAYVVFEMSFYAFENTRLSLAICAVAAFAGSDVLVTVRDLIIDILRVKVGSKK